MAQHVNWFVGTPSPVPPILSKLPDGGDGNPCSPHLPPSQCVDASSVRASPSPVKQPHECWVMSEAIQYRIMAAQDVSQEFGPLDEL